MTDKKQYGVFLGRFQPFHLGHMQVVSEIIADGLIPVLVVGGVNKDCHRHPYTPDQIENMIHRIYSSYMVGAVEPEIVKMKDYDSWDEWYGALDSSLNNVNADTDNRIFYVHRKPDDIQQFEFRGHMIQDHYIKVLEIAGEEVKDVTYPVRDIDATQIRNDLEANKHMLDGRVYKYIKALND